MDDPIKKALNFLKKNKIKYHYMEHKAIFTVDDIKKLGIKIPALGVKTLFLKDKKGKNFFLVSLSEDKNIDIKNFASRVGQKRLSFANENNLKDFLDVPAGSISPMALINLKEKNCIFCIDKDLVDAEKIAIHPNKNTATCILEKKEFVNFLSIFDIEKIIVKI